ncbi:putative fusion protein of n terminal phosphoserine phosphatase and c-terminal phosphatidate cytidylyltransferase [Candidatus Kuenenia stuttgartiensis]|jgi:dolichol kinase/phosphoserine phosphatase|uniref:Putative fusion protein of n terminal phosphoserine phosphatase and c-terminal phosphatidate cytidylyltransferase n=1 Tax=Kuenenia stuttgartiensis TaxID=174633 RepID=Q1Q722_KUEST|nr:MULTISPECIES: haloacid dehalogenase-like hydrolase [Kuenenia]MBE7548993.1 haloacid dehalogenase-like hydrolase [Planctomycetia bacterium]MCZ7611880.1 haloacid dehalogenase-like hydrolase [Ignavibacterium sp.]MBZ0191577.1 haloacid dehalogenase-like hydrolase [Candidatus Kuenenia stuttgartiensis]MCL4728479.1 haloacid dehalogenase-like hydrolase [Candidatus Kuenenia stuttgartiensis]MCZ7623563.1 haloacid dehalogenase-like hydrolase [Candidatus Kuenenia sp.]
MITAPKNKIIIFDVDGVLFRGHFLLHLSRRLGLLLSIRTFLLCILFNIGKLPFHTFIKRVYRSFRNIPLEQARKVYEEIPLIQNAKETIEILRGHGYLVFLISSGVPDVFVKDLAARVSANNGYGITVGIDNGALTGEIYGQLIMPEGKVNIIESELQHYDLSWHDVIVLVDDRNNSDILQKSNIGIGVNAQYSIRRQADYLIDNNNLSELLDILDIADANTYKALFSGMRKQFEHSWYQEIRRKLLHIIIALVPVFSQYIFITTLSVLFSIVVFYLISEFLRVNGLSFPLLGLVTKSSIRKREERGIAFGPITLILGAAFSILIFPKEIASAVIWIVAFSDAAATLVGKSIGKIRIPYNRQKSVEGSLAALAVAIICGCIFLPIAPALIAAFVACFIESLPLRAADNLLMPVGAGLILLCF